MDISALGLPVPEDPLLDISTRRNTKPFRIKIILIIAAGVISIAVLIGFIAISFLFNGKQHRELSSNEPSIPFKSPTTNMRTTTTLVSSTNQLELSTTKKQQQTSTSTTFIFKNISTINDCTTLKESTRTTSVNIPLNAKWIQNGITVAGGNGQGSQRDQLSDPRGWYVDNHETFYIADYNNDRIVEWKCGATTGRVVAGGNEKGPKDNQLFLPTDVIVDKRTDNLIICDNGNRRVVQWPRQGGMRGRTRIPNISCCGLTMDDEGFLYVTDRKAHEIEVRRWAVDEPSGTLVASVHGTDEHLDKSMYVFVDRDHSVYVSDAINHCVMKWVKGAIEGINVAGGHGQGNDLTQLSGPLGVFVDQLGTVYVADCWNHRVMRWTQGAKQGSIVVGGNGQGNLSNQLNYPIGLSFDQQGNLYVVDSSNHRVQRFSVAVS